jgi:hypothetical protein
MRVNSCNRTSAVFRPQAMRHLGTVVGAGLLMVLAAGCTSGGAVASGGGLTTATSATTVPSTTTSATTTAPPTGTGQQPISGVHLPADATPVAGRQVNASALPAAFPRTVWVRLGGKLLGFYGEEGGCFTSGATVTQQTDTQVVVRLIQTEPGTGTHACPMYVRYKPMALTLAKPLGTRTVVLVFSIVHG